MDEQTTTFDSWAIVEVMGHNKYAGRVTEQTVGGASLIRVDVPATDDHPEYCKLLGPSAIFAITPCSEEVARAAARHIYGNPIPVYIPASEDSPAALMPGQVDDDDDGWL